MNEQIRIALFDDHQLFLDTMTSRLSREPDLKVVGALTTSDRALELMAELQPDVVLMDVDLPGRGAFDVAEEILAQHESIGIIFLTGFLTSAFVNQAVRLPARGYLLKGEPVAFVIESIRKAAAGEVCYSESVFQLLDVDNETGRMRVRGEDTLHSLTAKQLEVLRKLAQGCSVKEIASSMGMSHKAVDSLKYRLMNRLDIHDRVQLARYAIREGLTLP